MASVATKNVNPLLSSTLSSCSNSNSCGHAASASASTVAAATATATATPSSSSNIMMVAVAEDNEELKSTSTKVLDTQSKDRTGYGLKCCGVRVPVAYRKSRLEDDALAYIMTSKIFNCPEKELTRLGFLPCVDHHALPKHKYYEGYFHGLETSDPLQTVNPRFHTSMQKPAAPLPLRAFAVAFRKLNATWIEEAIGDHPELRALWQKQYIFADFAIQVHFGDEVAGKHLHWHRDAWNSMLHLALGLHGSRALHTKESTLETDPLTEVVDWQEIGAAYVSSPFAFMHAVEYPKCTWQNRIIAIQLRILMDPKKRQTDPTDSILSQAPQIMANISQALSQADLRIPTLQEMKEAEKHLSETKRA